MQVATFQVPLADAKKLLDKAKLKAGWSVCSLSIIQPLQSCYRCLGYGHKSFDCRSPDRSKLCRSDRYYRSKSCLTDKAKELQGLPEQDQSTRANDSMVHGVLDHVRLPQIKLQSFNGDIDEWISFRDLFTSLIHWRTDLPEVDKFHYLKGCLQGEPKALIDPLKITQANYKIAWDALTKRYNNSKQLNQRQVQSLFSLPSLSKESVSELHVLVEGFERIVHTLDQVVEPAEYKDLLLVNLLTNRLYRVTRRGWEEFSSTKEQDTLEDLTEFLQRRIRVLESLPTKAAESRGAQPWQQQPQRQKQSTAKASYSTMQSSSGAQCVACKESHYLHQCGVFQRMSVTDRDALLQTHFLCRNCFRVGHLSKGCRSKFNCKNCKGRHHTLVCFRSEKGSSAKVAAVARGNHPSIPKESFGVNEASGSGSSQVVNMAATDISVSGAAHQYSSQVLLATAIVVVEDDQGGRFPARALLDSGSESNFITERLSQRMKTQRERVDISVRGIGQAGTKVKYKIQAVVRSRISSFSQAMNFLVLPNVTVNLPTATMRTEGTERRLARNANLHKSYNDFMEEYESMGHMEKVEEAALTTKQQCFLPHHPVFKEDSTTTKVSY
ncbi:uncharacterized protein LOC134222172 [Armigeres subalbatus]|uniref:uncharacterized protein LOC134222172 n=1 Tax=Armigeres subalbatus TaxID=124917 RepID=UPI002ED60BF6